jgi:hypothetical protein
MRGRYLSFIAIYVTTLLLCFDTAETSHFKLRRRRQLQSSRPYYLWSAEQIHSTLLQWQSVYPNLVKVTPAQDAYGLLTAGGESD